MTIPISEHAEIFHVPYGPPNNDGTPDGSYVNVKDHLEWISVLPSCLGWPEIQRLLRVINAPSTPLMSLAADQGIAEIEHPERPFALTSFVLLCLADIPANSKSTITSLTNFLQNQLTEQIQHIADTHQRPLHLEVRLELQPTQFHLHQFAGWSLKVLLAASESDNRLARHTWSLGVRALEQAAITYSASQDN